MLKDKSSLDANLHLLKSQRAEAEAEEVEEETGEHGQLPDVNKEPLSTVQRTSEYIQQHSYLFFQEQPLNPAPAETNQQLFMSTKAM